MPPKQPTLYKAPLLGAATPLSPAPAAPEATAPPKRARKTTKIPTPPESDSEVIATGTVKPKRTLSEETKAKLKAARQAKADAKKRAAEEAEAARQAALSEETQRAAAAQAKKEAAAERRRQNRLLKKGMEDALGPSEDTTKSKGKGKAPASVSASVTSETPQEEAPKKTRKRKAPTASTSEDEPPKWFHTYVKEIMAEDLEQKGQKPTKKLQQQVQQKAKDHWSDGVRREQIQHAMDTHRQDMYSMIFGGMTR